MKILYLDCFSGISGDMTIGALLDAGGDFEHLVAELKKLHIEGEYQLNIQKVVKNGIASTKFDVLLEENTVDLHHHTHETDLETHTDHQHTHEHIHSHSHGHAHHHRAYSDIVKLIKESDLSDKVKNVSLQMFEIIGKAEGKIHGKPLEEVHFHEVGAVDSIIDIVGTAILVEQLAVDVVKSSPVPTGSGHIHIDHGIYPVPAPATLEVLRNIPIAQSNRNAELTTPTGAAIVAVLASDYCTLPSMKVEQIGYGAGTKTFPNHPNVLRIVIGEL
ncbi:hypothetical protein BN1058_01718 [Paraliobacillus sp. PM-2]|uniref:LarC family nickel insertion protein n=1 Tax=Paraliobacillus sp. PM-2 TaxID=1462524 RepID=UPI00061BD9ED|nr:LarC family nickel insertion protein [Paraliobacillus sp. PM-2]CQR47406.1 hypothetical protein BN1058_01718 [Paraliobacillus sp. PM-2]